MKQNDLTLAICMYNAERYIEETLGCVMEQTIQNFHLLIIDDCSTDGSLDKVERFFANNMRQYELISFEENHGIAYARNYALHHATTKYLIFIDSDDLPLPQFLEKEYNLLKNDQELMAVSSWLSFIDTKSNLIGGGLFIGATNKQSFRKHAERNKLIFLPIQTMFERGLAIQVGGFQCEGFPIGKPRYRDYCEDLDLWTRLSDLYKENRYIVTIPEVLYYYRKADSLSANHFNMIIKMRYTKINLLRRRTGQKELTFEEFYSRLSKKEMKSLQRNAKAADSLRNGVFYLKKKSLKGIWLIIASLWYKPSYLFDKLKHNIK